MKQEHGNGSPICLKKISLIISLCFEKMPYICIEKEIYHYLNHIIWFFHDLTTVLHRLWTCEQRSMDEFSPAAEIS